MLEHLTKITSEIDKFLASSSENPVVVLYGAGFAMPAIYKKLESHGFSIAAICDSNPDKRGLKFREQCPILSLDEAVRKFPRARFVIASPNYFWEIHSILGQVVDARNICDVDLECTHYFNEGDFHAFFLSEFDRFQRVYDWLEDDESRDTYYKVVKAHMSGRRRDFEFAFTGNSDWYLFRSLLKPSVETTYIDCGAFDGDTIKLFLAAADSGYRKIIALEPDPSMQPNLRALSDSQNGKVLVIPKGASDTNGSISFATDGVYSNIVKGDVTTSDELITIPIATLDSLLTEEDVSIVKMDIEGGEYDALNGAAEVIKRCRPKLAICLYHRVDDFVRIPELIRQMVPEYKLRLKHQSKGCTDTILFATVE